LPLQQRILDQARGSARDVRWRIQRALVIPERIRCDGVVLFARGTPMLRRWMHALCALGITAGLVAAPTSAAANEPGAHVEAQHFAVVRISIRHAVGTVLSTTQTVPWGEVASFDLSCGEHSHRVAIDIEDAHRADLTYARDGAVLVDDRSVETHARQATVVHEDDQATLTLRVIKTSARISISPPHAS
jgi:hypothetical protein